MSQKKIDIDITKLKVGFNIVKDEEDYSVVANKRNRFTQFWVKKIALLTFIINALTCVILLITFVLILLRPAPKYYASSEKGSVYLLQSNKKNLNK